LICVLFRRYAKDFKKTGCGVYRRCGHRRDLRRLCQPHLFPAPTKAQRLDLLAEVLPTSKFGDLDVEHSEHSDEKSLQAAATRRKRRSQKICFFFNDSRAGSAVEGAGRSCSTGSGGAMTGARSTTGERSEADYPGRISRFSRKCRLALHQTQNPASLKALWGKVCVGYVYYV
jgi:hypothetical protein